MHPIFIRLGDFAIHTYGVLVAVGFALGLWLAARRARVAGIDHEQVQLLGVWLIVAGMLGAKLFYIVFFWHDFVTGWRVAGIPSLREGFVFYGGFIGAIGATILFARTKQLPLWRLADVLAPLVALGHVFGRLGCFFNGCCYGHPCRLPWAVRFPDPHVLAGTPLHPTQLYEAAGNLALFAGLLAFDRRRRFDGQVWWTYVVAYGVLRFGIEFFRGDYEARYAGVLTLSQFIALALIVAGVVGLVTLRRAGQRA